MLEKIVGLKQLSILQCQKLAKEVGFDSTQFDLCGPKGKKKAKWIDAHLGILEIEGVEGAVIVHSLAFVQHLWCENVMPKGQQEEDG